VIAKLPDPSEYLRRAAAVIAAAREIDETFPRVRDRWNETDPATLAWRAACVRFHASCDAFYAPLWELIDKLRGGDASAAEPAIRFLEADPMCFRSGYLKAKIAHYICRSPLDGGQRERLMAVVVSMVDRRNTAEFGEYCKLAAKLDDPNLRAALTQRLYGPDPAIARRARWMLDRIAQGFGLPHRVSPGN
jgi:hypothetical protein